LTAADAARARSPPAAASPGSKLSTIKSATAARSLFLGNQRQPVRALFGGKAFERRFPLAVKFQELFSSYYGANAQAPSCPKTANTSWRGTG